MTIGFHIIVTDYDRVRLSDADITLYKCIQVPGTVEQCDDTGIFVITDSNGECDIELPSYGRYYVSAIKYGIEAESNSYVWMAINPFDWNKWETVYLRLNIVSDEDNGGNGNGNGNDNGNNGDILLLEWIITFFRNLWNWFKNLIEGQNKNE